MVIAALRSGSRPGRLQLLAKTLDSLEGGAELGAVGVRLRAAHALADGR